MIIDFPPVQDSDPYGPIAVGGDFTPSTLLKAYTKGIFPWPNDIISRGWYSPDPRGILEFKNLHISRSLKKFIKKNIYKISFNTCFDQVIRTCAEVHRNSSEGTWINDEIVNAYQGLHRIKKAYSIEVFSGDHNLVGGLYGVCIGQMFSGESMFSKETNASKVALLTLMYSLKKMGVSWLDTQMITPVVESLGGQEIPRKKFLKILEASVSRKDIWPINSNIYYPFI